MPIGGAYWLLRRSRRRTQEEQNATLEPEQPKVDLGYTPVNRRWFVDSEFGVLWLILALGTAGLFFICEWLVYDIIDLVRMHKSRKK